MRKECLRGVDTTESGRLSFFFSSEVDRMFMKPKQKKNYCLFGIAFLSSSKHTFAKTEIKLNGTQANTKTNTRVKIAQFLPSSFPEAHKTER